MHDLSSKSAGYTQAKTCKAHKDHPQGIVGWHVTKRNDLRIPFAEWLYRMSESAVPYQARALAVYAVAFKMSSNEELACLVGMDTKGIADKTYNKWKKYLSDNGWVIIKQVTVGRLTTIEVDPAFRETPVTFTDLASRNLRKFYGTSPVPITDALAVEITGETVKVTDAVVEITAVAKEKSPCNPLKENNKTPLQQARDIPLAPRELAGLNGSADPMISDILGWMGSGTEANARQWLSTFVQQFGQEVVRNSYMKLKTDVLSGSIIAKHLQTWTKIAQRMKAEPRAGDAEQANDGAAAKQAWQRQIIADALRGGSK